MYGTLLPSVSADGRTSGDVIAFEGPISYGFAYGSAVALQDGTAAGKM